MINLADVVNVDPLARFELEVAGIPVKTLDHAQGGLVKTTLVGVLHGWIFTREWNYWVAEADPGKGLSLEKAAEMFKRPFDVEFEGPEDIRRPRFTSKLGSVVRVCGLAGVPYPDEEKHAAYYDFSGRRLILDKDGKVSGAYEVLREQCENNKVPPIYIPPKESFVKPEVVKNGNVLILIERYAIDTQHGLNEFARMIRELNEAH